MTTTALPEPVSGSPVRAALARAARYARTERGIVTLALGAIGLHIADDNYLQPEPGTSPLEHLASGLVPIGLLAAVAVLYPRVRAGVRGWLALTFGALGIAFGVPSAYWLSQGEASGDHYTTGPLAILAGIVLMVTGLAVLWRSRRSYGSRTRTYLRRALTLAVSAALAFATFWLVVFPVGFAYTYTHTGRGVVEPDLRVPYEQVTVTTSDSVELTGSYVPSKNRAAVILFPGATRSAEARMLIRHGYGVLLLNPRGQGTSEGDTVRWAGDRDLLAGAEYLKTRPDVDDDRIGGFGFSVGGEILIVAAAQSTDFKAIVSEGAGYPIGEADLKGVGHVLRPSLDDPGARDRRLLQPDRTAADRRPDRRDRAARRLPDPRRPRHGRRGRPAAEVLRRRRAAEAALEGAGSRPHRRPEGAAGRVRAPRRRLLRPRAARRVGRGSSSSGPAPPCRRSSGPRRRRCCSAPAARGTTAPPRRCRRIRPTPSAPAPAARARTRRTAPTAA